ncbi:Carbon monoxide dehydrogenase small chain [bioreactor metagenome]|uniref:Carbon monoxide dehydrogenase small chain n=1 Tax=bioreactor metagenome TaxID=1076179 RepID=A0A645E9P1_9ZZZZ
MSEKITFVLNGAETTVDVDPEMMLLDVLRDVLDLTGTKCGCDNSTCGTCVVVINGKSTKSCNTAIKKVAGAEVITIEGLAKGMELHPIQQSLAESGAVQCGFCTPGIIMELYGLLENNPNATQVEMENALNKHLCRCTGYEPIRDGALMAQKLMQDRK